MRSRINRWYRQLQTIERSIEAGVTADELRRRLVELEALEYKVRQLSMPVAYGNPLYSLRRHIGLLRDELRSAIERGG